MVGYNLVLFIVGVPKLCGKNTFRNRDADYVHFPMSVMVIQWLPDGRFSNVTFSPISALRNTKFYTFVVELLPHSFFFQTV